MKTAFLHGMKVFIASLFSCLALHSLGASDIFTVSGRKYLNVHDVTIRGDVVSFSTDLDIVKLKLSDLTADTRNYYLQKQAHSSAATISPATTSAPVSQSLSGDWKSHSQIQQLEQAVAKGIQETRRKESMTVSYNDAFHLADLEKAKEKAAREGKLLGFIMEWDKFFDVPSNPQEQGSERGLAHFYGVFNQALVLVFVRHEKELQDVPEAVKKGFFGPDEGGFAPNMAVTDATATDFIVEIPYGGDHSVGPVREKIFVSATNRMIDYLKTKGTQQ